MIEGIAGWSLVRTIVRMVTAYAAAIFAAWAVARIGLSPGSILIPSSAVLVMIALFVFRPAEGLGAFLLLSLLANTLQYQLQADLRYFDELGLLLLVPTALVHYGLPKGRLRIGVAEIALAVVAVTGIASSLASGVPLWIWLPGLLLLMKGSVFFYLVYGLRLDLGHVIRVGVVILAVATVLLLLGFLELMNPRAFQHSMGLPSYLASRGGIVVVKSLFLHPALFGWLTVYASLVLYAFFILFRRWWVLILALAFNVGTVLSGRRTPIVGLILALVVGAAWYWFRRPVAGGLARSLIPVVAALALVALAFFPVLTGFYRQTVSEYLDAPHAMSEIFSQHPNAAVVAKVEPRTALYLASLAIARDHFPLGVGLGRFGSFMSRLDYSPIYHQYGLDRVSGLGPKSPIAIDDTFWPSVLGETGPVGLLGFILFIGTLFVRLWRATSACQTRVWLGLSLGALLIFVQGLVASLTAATFVAPPIAYFVFGAAGAILALAAADRHELAPVVDKEEDVIPRPIAQDPQ